jgi:2-phospho-L-lactate/phosphoenolpyruvate guanylyltransferase
VTTWAVIPVKDFSRAKSRLAPVLSPGQRAQLSRRLFINTVCALRDTPDVAGVIVVTDSREVAWLASTLRAIAIGEPPKAALCEIVDGGVAEAMKRGAEAILICTADLPFAAPRHFARVLGVLARVDAVLVPDLAEQGTATLAFRTSRPMPSCFGNPDSLARHRRSAEKSGLFCLELRIPALGFDVDTPADLGWLTAASARAIEAEAGLARQLYV